MTERHLYFSPQPTRSARARWAFLEADVPFEGHSVDIFEGQHQSEAYRAVNPLGKVPSAVLDGESVIESAALAWIAASEGPNGSLIPETGTAEWRRALQWTVFAPAELDHYLVTMNAHRLLLPPTERDPAALQQAVDLLSARLTLLTNELADRPYLLGDAFSVADVCVGHSIAWTQMHDHLAGFPGLRAYLHRLERRPAFQQVYGPRVEVYPDPHAE